MRTMVCFMHFCKKISVFLALLLVCAYAFAAANSILIKNATLVPQEDFYTLNADIEFNFDKEIEEAINKGVPLNFLVEFQIVSPRKYWFDDEIITTSQSVSLSYHALSRLYLVNRGRHQVSFETLSEAKRALAVLDDWKVAEKSQLEKTEAYRAALLVRLDQSKLPKAIQVDAIASEKWNLISEKFVWVLKDLNSNANSKELGNKESTNKEFGTKEPNKDSGNKESFTRELFSRELNLKEPSNKEPAK